MARLYDKPGTIRSFNATSEINDEIKAANIKKGELTGWINDKIAKGIIFDRNPTPEAIREVKMVQKVRVRY